MYNYSIGKRIKDRRTAMGISQEQLALRAEVTPAYLGQVERDERNPTVGLLGRVADVLEIELASFFRYRDEGKSPSEDRILCALEGLDEEDKARVADIAEAAVLLVKGRGKLVGEE